MFSGMFSDFVIFVPLISGHDFLTYYKDFDVARDSVQSDKLAISRDGVRVQSTPQSW